MSGRDGFKQVAEETYVDPTNIDCSDKENVQGVLEDVCGGIATSASPGFTYGRSGNLPAGTWLLNDTVPSNITGRPIYVYNAILTAVFIRFELSTTCDVVIYEHDGTTYTVKHTVSVVASKEFDDILTTPVSLTKGKQLAVRIENGSAKNADIGCQLNGTLVP